MFLNKAADESNLDMSNGRDLEYYLDMTKDMGYLFICYECEPVKQTLVTDGPGVAHSSIEDEEVSGGTKYFKVSLSDVEFDIRIEIKDMEGEPKYKRNFYDAANMP